MNLKAHPIAVVQRFYALKKKIKSLGKGLISFTPLTSAKKNPVDIGPAYIICINFLGELHQARLIGLLFSFTFGVLSYGINNRVSLCHPEWESNFYGYN